MNSYLAGLAPTLADHLWQSTAFAVVAWLLTLALRRNQARIRYTIWLTASIKFLVPFSLLVAAGDLLPHPNQPITPMVYSAIDVVEEPFADIAAPLTAPAIHVPTLGERIAAVLPVSLGVLWALGSGAVLVVFAFQWRQVRRTLSSAEPVGEGREFAILRRLEERFAGEKNLELRLSGERTEPGVFGGWRQVLVWPQAFSAQLDDEHIEAILAHELMHVRSRDNLTAALHMLVETLFWFHPMVWLMERRMVREREQACDEAVVDMGGDAGIYAESLLKTVRFCVESPLACVSGVTGGELKQRVLAIVTGRALLRLTWPKKLLLAAAAVCVVAAPVLVGQSRTAQHMMLAAISAAPKPVQLAAHAMIPVADTPSSELIAETQAPSIPAAAAPTADDMSLGPEFEVATIRPSDPNERGGGSSVNNAGRFEGRNTTLEGLVRFAYADWQSYGGEQVDSQAAPWTKNARIDVEAKLSDEEMASFRKLTYFQQTEYVRPMLRRLLVDRFHLKLRTEQRMTDVSAMVIAKGGAKLKDVGVPAPPENLSQEEMKQRMQDTMAHKAPPMAESFSMGSEGWRGTALPIGTLMTEIVANAHLTGPFVNLTGLNSYYDFAMKVSREPDAPPLIDQVEQQLGLRIEPRKVPLTYFVITAADQPTVDGAEVGNAAAPAGAKAVGGVVLLPAAYQSPAGVAVQPGAGGVPAAGTSGAYVPTMTFDVASIRETKPTGPMRVGGTFEPPGSSHLDLTNVPIVWLIQDGYRAARYQITGAPDWVNDNHAIYNVEARADAAADAKLATLTDDQVKLEQQHMIQVLLAERFNFKVHWETRQGGAQNLVAVKGAKLHPGGSMPPAADELKRFGDRPIPPISQQRNGDLGQVLVGHNCSMKQLASLLGNFQRMTVVDTTGLTGTYDFVLRYSQASDREREQNPQMYPSIPDALEEQLGLKLENGTGPTQVLVVDHIDRPSAN